MWIQLTDEGVVLHASSKYQSRSQNRVGHSAGFLSLAILSGRRSSLFANKPDMRQEEARM